MGRRIGYARVSADDQNLSIQKAALDKDGCAIIFEEKRSDTKRNGRDQLDLALKVLSKGDTLVVARLDRLGRSLRNYEGRGWRGFHHHPALAIAAYGFLVAERSPVPPQPRSSKQSQAKRRQSARATYHTAPPLRPERHTPESISTLRTMIAVALANRLPRCPCCMRKQHVQTNLI